MTASVYVKHRGILDNPNSLLVTKIKRLVSSAIPGLEIDNVSVVSDRALYADITLEQVPRGERKHVWKVEMLRRLQKLNFFLSFGTQKTENGTFLPKMGHQRSNHRLFL